MKRGPFFSAAVLLGVFAAAFLLSVPVVEKVPLCFFHHVTGLDCPGCGLVRSFISIAHGQFREAVRFNALGPLVFLFFLFSLVRLIFSAFGRDLASLSWKMPRGGVSYALFGLLFWGQWLLKLMKEIKI